jgi:2-haloacid dehalogenase
MSGPARNVVFDLGGVLIDWDPRHLYRKLIADEAEMERFLAEVCNGEWNLRHDAGRAFADGVAELVTRHPQASALIEAYWERWPEMLGGAIDETVELLAALKARRVPLFALTNWSAETWPHAVENFGFLDQFDGIVVSGFEGVAKPEPAIYLRLLERYHLVPAATLYFDDVPANVEASCRLGIKGHRFLGAGAARRVLEGENLL